MARFASRKGAESAESESTEQAPEQDAPEQAPESTTEPESEQAPESVSSGYSGSGPILASALVGKLRKVEKGQSLADAEAAKRERERQEREASENAEFKGLAEAIVAESGGEDWIELPFPDETQAKRVRRILGREGVSPRPLVFQLAEQADAEGDWILQVRSTRATGAGRPSKNGSKSESAEPATEQAPESAEQAPEPEPVG